MTAASTAPDIATPKGLAAVARRLAYVLGVYAAFAGVGLAFGAGGLRWLLAFVLALALIETGGLVIGAVTALAVLGLQALSPTLQAAACLTMLVLTLVLIFSARPGVGRLAPLAYRASLATALVSLWTLPGDLPWIAIVVGVFTREFAGGFFGQWGRRLGLREPLIRYEVSPNKGWFTFLASSGVAAGAVWAITGSWRLAAPMLLCQWGDLANSLFKRGVGKRHSGRLFGGEQGGWGDSFAVFAAPILGYEALRLLGPL